MDRCFEYEEVTKPLTWLGKAKSFEHAIDVLAQYEAKVAKFENKYGETLDERAKMVALITTASSAIGRALRDG